MLEFGGLPEALANLYTITGRERYLATAERFYHAAVLDPLAGAAWTSCPACRPT